MKIRGPDSAVIDNQLGKAAIVNENEVFLQTGKELFGLRMATRRGHRPDAVPVPRHSNRDVGAAIIAPEQKVDRSLLARMKFIYDVAVALLGVLKGLEPRYAAVDGEMNGFEDRAFSDAIGRVNRVDGIGLEFEDEGVAVVVDPAESFDRETAQKIAGHDLASTAA